MYIEINFLIEFGLGLCMLIMAALKLINLTLYSNSVIMLSLASGFQLFAEYFLFWGIAVGIVGCVVAVVSSNFVYVCIVSAFLG
jgi:hypothetical protein